MIGSYTTVMKSKNDRPRDIRATGMDRRMSMGSVRNWKYVYGRIRQRPAEYGYFANVDSSDYICRRVDVMVRLSLEI
jgi:hypothetical protein